MIAEHPTNRCIRHTKNPLYRTLPVRWYVWGKKIVPLMRSFLACLSLIWPSLYREWSIKLTRFPLCESPSQADSPYAISTVSVVYDITLSREERDVCQTRGFHALNTDAYEILHVSQNRVKTQPARVYARALTRTSINTGLTREIRNSPMLFSSFQIDYKPLQFTLYK